MSTHRTVCTLTDLQKSDKYQRALSLNFDCGSDTLRRMIETLLDDKGITFKKYVSNSSTQSKIRQLISKHILHWDQVNLINSRNPDLESMDVTLLTTVLLELFHVTGIQTTSLKALRKKRNELAHKPRTMLEDDVPFIEARKLILALSKDISNEFEEEMGNRIEELKKRELVRTKSNLEVIILNGEALMVKLVECEKNEQVDGNNETWIKLGLTKYVRQLARSLDVDVLLQDLKKLGVINDTLKRTIEQTYNYEEQMQQLVLHMMDETRENLLKFCSCLRKINSLLADLVQHKPSDEKEIELSLKQEEQKKIKQIITDAFLEEEKCNVACEDIHIFVEEKRKCRTTFQNVLESVQECFPHVVFEENDSRFRGITPKVDAAVLSEDPLIAEGSEEVLTDMACDKFGPYLARKMEETREGIGRHFDEVCLEECISAKIFGKVTDDQLKNLFSPRLEKANIKYGFGIKTALSDVQKIIKRQLNRNCPGQVDTLRKFDTPAGNFTYTKSTVRPATGNLLTPAHEFIYPTSKKQCTTAFMAKEVTRFALACINGRKNGTIHFGIREALNRTGEVIGLPRGYISDAAKLNAEIYSCIACCFEVKHQLIAERCIRPVQVIPVEEDTIVLEVDIVPFSSHARENFVLINYPPKGNQRQKCFAYRENMVATINQSKLEAEKNDFKELFVERLYLEREAVTSECSPSARTVQKLKKLLTGGSKFVTDAFVPVIFSGNITGCQNEASVRSYMSSMSIAFTSSAGVFDFDSSVDLRYLIEKENTFFVVKMPEDFNSRRMRRESDMTGDNKIWLYSNGNEELDKDRMSTEMWYSKRLEGVHVALNQIRQQIPPDRGLLIFLVFQKPVDQDPMFEIVRETFLKTFKGECIIIAENDELVQDWRKEMKGRLTKQDFESKIVTGLTWDEIILIVKSVFRPSKDVLYKFPDSRGQIIEMTSRELDELNLQTLELVDGYAEEHCRLQEEEYDAEECRNMQSEEQESFYKGNEVSWWNFYYSHVGRRDKYDYHKQQIRIKLQSVGSMDRFDKHQIEHNPGAGGSTLARQMLWHFSQMKETPGKAYRCCIIHRITEDTAEEIYKFKTFKDKSDTKPVIVLVDNKSEEHLNILKARIDETAYKKGSPGKLFCLLVIISRVPVSHRSSRETNVLEHNLTKKERGWFDKKFEELTCSRDVNIDTLIAFNVMRHSFDIKFIEDTTQQLANDITNQEKKLLEALSLICSFDSDNPVPETVFDSLMLKAVYDPNTLQLEQCLKRPFGILWSEKERKAMQRVDRETWNINLTGAMQLFITHRRINSDTRLSNGVCILSQPLSKAILNHIMKTEEKSFEQMVDNLLELLRHHCLETNAMSKHFIRIVCSLFTYRETHTDKGEVKPAKFSALVLQLEKQSENENTEQAQKRVTEMMNKCFEISGNAMVGQQLARYHYHIKDYDSAEKVIKRCLNILPQNSYLLDTYGQIFKSKMEQIIGSKNDVKMNDVEAAEAIELAFRAVEKFRRAQDASTSNEDNPTFNSNCFYMEVMTALYLLENFHKFECFGDKETFWSFLNEADFAVKGSPYENILKRAPDLEQFRNGRETQHHIEDSLRTLEEKRYMTRNHMTAVITPTKDLLLVKPRERFELFYGSKEHTLQSKFLFGIGLRLLMEAYQQNESRNILRKRQEEAERRLHSKDTVELERDLLVYLGYIIIQLSNQDIQIDLSGYRKLLNYSTQLWQMQREKKRPKERPYVEAYLYYALLHWLLPSRTDAGLENLSHPETYLALVKDWDIVYMENQHIKSKDQLFKQMPKIYFALGSGKTGNDIVDLEWLRHKWRNAKSIEGRKRKEVKADNHWHHPVFEEHLVRLFGTVDSTGRWISTEVQYRKRSYSFRIRTNENHSSLSNRAVTFVLGFSWKAPVALDVRRADRTLKRQNSHQSSDNAEENILNSELTKPASIIQQGNKCSTVSEKALIDEPEFETSKVSESAPPEASGGFDTRGLPQRTKKKANGGLFSESAHTSEMASESARGRGRGRGRGIEISGARQRSVNPRREGNDIQQNAQQAVRPKMHPKVALTTPNYPPGAPSLDKSAGEKTLKAKDQIPHEDGSVAIEGNEYEDEKEWCKVSRKKKTQQMAKEEQAAIPKVSIPVQQTPSSLTPKEKFEKVIDTCQMEFPRVKREKLIKLYNKVKENHGGSVKGLGIENILNEIGKRV